MSDVVERLSELVGFSSLSLDGFSSLPLPLFCLYGFPSLSPALLPFSIYDMLIFRQLVSHRRVNKSCKSTPIKVFFFFWCVLITGSVTSPYFHRISDIPILLKVLREGVFNQLRSDIHSPKVPTSNFLWEDVNQISIDHSLHVRIVAADNKDHLPSRFNMPDIQSSPLAFPPLVLLLLSLYGCD